MNYIIRKLRQVEVKVLDTFLYEAIYIPEGLDAPPMEIINRPELQVYVDGFGTKDGDICFVAETDGVIVGAVWVRIMDDYEHLDNKTPSVAVQKQNYTVKMYKNVGFEIVDENEEEYIMVCRL